MSRFEDKIAHEPIDGLAEYDNPAPRWLMWMFYGAIIFSVLFIAWYALSFGDESYDADWRAAAIEDKAAIQAWFDKNPLVPPTSEELLAGATNEEILALAKARYAKTCASCHGEQAQGLIGPNLTDEYWQHGGTVAQIFDVIVKGVPAKGMPPWGRALPPAEIAALVSYLRSLQGSEPPGGRAPEGPAVPAEPLPGGGV